MGKDLDARQYLLSLQQNYQGNDDIESMIEDRLKKLNK
jgi:tetratricopeptide repeat protein